MGGYTATAVLSSPTFVLGAGVLFFFVAYAGFAFSGNNVVVLAALFGIGGVAIGLVETAEHAAVASPSPPQRVALGLPLFLGSDPVLRH